MSIQGVHREHIIAVLDAAIRAVDPRAAVRAHVARSGDVLRIGDRSYRLSELDRIIVVGGGKAGAPMAAAVHELLGGADHGRHGQRQVRPSRRRRRLAGAV